MAVVFALVLVVVVVLVCVRCYSYIDFGVGVGVYVASAGAVRKNHDMPTGTPPLTLNRGHFYTVWAHPKAS